MSEIGDMHKEMKERSKILKQKRAVDSVATLKRLGIVYAEKNNGMHLILEGRDYFIDFWPSTGNWCSRDGTKGRGLKQLLTLMGM